MVNDNPTIGLYGIEGVYNYGCEAIVRGTEIILREYWPDMQIKYASKRPIDDKERLKGCDVKIIDRKLHNLYSINILNGLIAHQTGIYSKKLFQEDLGWIKDCDIIFSIGGDLYTLPPYYKDPRSGYYNPLIHFGEVVRSQGKKLVIWGASIGPFEGYPKAKKAFIDHLSQVDLITSREPGTTKYLKDLGIENVIEYQDPAFAISNPKDDHNHLNSDKIHIGINLSPLSTIYSFKSDMNEIIKNQADLIETIIKKFDANVTLIPHVVCDFNIKDDDLRYLKRVMSFIDQEFIDQVELLDKDIGFIGTKEKILTCDVVIAARMHCAINAVASGVPTIFLSYSKKAHGMADYVYGNDKWVFPLKDLDKRSIIDFIIQIIDKKLNTKTMFKERNNNIKSLKRIINSFLE